MMFGFEIWFVLAIFSAISGGLFIFTTKVAAERDYDAVLIITSAVAVSSVFLFGVVVYLGDYTGLSYLVLLYAAINAVGYAIGNIARHYALQSLDTAVYYPIYKTLTPIIAITIGFVFFYERFTVIEIIGLLLSLSVPLLLITKAEHARQNDMSRGLRLMFVSAILATISAAALKAATIITENVWLFIAISDAGLVFVGILMFYFKKSEDTLKQRLGSFSDTSFLWLMFWMGLTSAVSFAAMIFAFKYGTLSVVYTVQSLYILIPIILSIIYYNEHWNIRKVFAIILSIVALGLLK